ncbi:MAG: hypothetical protein KDE20_06265 [Caldilineaceae bacterium]|nr:hypothetical protein [Caldilineaceae bacterium]
MTAVLLLDAKLTRPGHTAGYVDRPRLYARLSEWRTRRAIVIQAPAGYGKSSLVSRWLDADDLVTQTAWLNLDEGDADPARFMHYVAGALEGVRPGAQDLVRRLLEESHSTPQHALTQLLAVYDTLGPRNSVGSHNLLVLDDLQRVQSADVTAMIASMLEHGPPTLHLIIITRQRTDLPLARLFAHEAIRVVDAGDLRFSEEEIGLFLAAKGYDGSTPAQLAELADRSEGWVTALQLAVLAARAGDGVPCLIRALQGGDDWLAAFLTDEVLHHQTPALQRFLLETSVLDEFTGSLCAAVTGDAAGPQHLAALIQRDVFTIRLGDHGWYRYHHLFQELLQERLKLHHTPEQIDELHRRAAAWLADAGRIEGAVSHFLAAGDEDRAADLVEAQVGITLTRAPYQAQQLFSLLPQAVIERRPRLTLDRCFLAAAFDRLDLSMVEQAEASIAQAYGSDDVPRPLLGESLVWRGVAALLKVDLDTARRHAGEAEPYAAVLPDHVAGSLHFLNFGLAQRAGDHAPAFAHGQAALDAFDRARFPIGIVAVRREMAKAAMYRGDCALADQYFRALFDDWRHERAGVTHDLSLAYLYAAENRYLQNDLAQARSYCDHAHQLAQHIHDEELIAICVRLAEFYALVAGHAAADAPSNMLRARSYTVRAYRAHALDVETRYQLVAGRVHDAGMLIEEPELTALDGTDDYRRLLLRVYLRAYIARGADLEKVEPLLARVVNGTAEAGEHLLRLHFLALTAWLQLQTRGADAVTSVLTEAIDLARATGYVRVLLDTPALIPQISRIDPDFVVRPELSPSTPHGGALLTEGEQRIMDLLVTDLSYREIAEALTISINTVRDYVRKIYQKLGVHDRQDAVARAKSLGAPHDTAE